MPNETLIHLFHDDTVVQFGRSPEHTASRMGGPLERDLTGVRHGPAPLHHLATISGLDFPTVDLVNDLPLIYGMRFPGCDMKYRYNRRRILDLQITPRRSAANWPYAGYPDLLPFVPLTPGRPKRRRWDGFRCEFWNLPDKQSAEFVAVVPPPASIGFSLWGASGDAEGVAIVFECDLKKAYVRAYNVCS